MNRWIKTWIVLALAFFLMCMPAAAGPYKKYSNQEPTYSEMAVDLLVVRPVGLLATTLGCALYTVSLPFTVWSEDRITKAGYNYVINPGYFTFVRPLGEQVFR